MQSPVFADNTSVGGDGTVVHPLEAIGGGGTPGGEDTDVQFNDHGAFGGDGGLTYDTAAGIFFANLPIIGSGSATAGWGLTAIGDGAAGGGGFLSAGIVAELFLDMGTTDVGVITMAAVNDGDEININVGSTEQCQIDMTTAPSGMIISCDDNAQNGVQIESESNGDESAQVSLIVTTATNTIETILSTTGFLVKCGPNASVANLIEATPASELGFFGVTPVVQAATPTTLPEVITILQNLGFCA